MSAPRSGVDLDEELRPLSAYLEQPVTAGPPLKQKLVHNWAPACGVA